MCGLVGLFSVSDNGLTLDQYNMFEASMIFNQMRGDDSTGVVTVSNKLIWSYVKAVGGYRSLQRDPAWPQLKQQILDAGQVVFGHGRYATRGHISLDNAHPFHIKSENNRPSLILIHNGTLEYYQTLPRFHEFKVDSEWLGTMIATYGAEKALSEIDGAIASIWWDDKDNTFNFYRNSARPLAYMYDKRGNFFLNSEITVLQFLNYKFNLGIPSKNIYSLKENVWHKCAIIGPQMGDLTITPIKPLVKKVVSSFTNKPYVSMLRPEDKRFWDRSIDMVEWRDNKKIITYRNKTIEIIEKQQPPEPYLLRMYESAVDGNIIKCFQYPDRANCEYVKYTYEEFKKLIGEEIKEIPKESKESITSKQGNVVRFSTRMPPNNNKIKHKGVTLAATGLPYLTTYDNQNDGSVALEEEVVVEVLYIEERVVGEKPLNRIVCARLKPKQDFYIDYQFYTSLTKDEINLQRFFKGNVGAIRLKSPEERKEEGAHVICSLHSVKPCTETGQSTIIISKEINETTH